MAHNVRVNGIVEESIVDGPGIRYVIFTQGCKHACKGCHNPESHDINGGYLVSSDLIMEQFTSNPLLAGITFSGGEPFLQPEVLCHIGEQVKALGKNIFTYTGFTFERLYPMAQSNPHIAKLLELTDVLVDGPFIEEQRNLELLYRGSNNQRLLNKEDRTALAKDLA